MVYNVKANNKTARPRAIYALYIGPNDSSTGHIVFKLSPKNVVKTPKFKPRPIAEDIITSIESLVLNSFK